MLSELDPFIPQGVLSQLSARIVPSTASDDCLQGDTQIIFVASPAPNKGYANMKFDQSDAHFVIPVVDGASNLPKTEAHTRSVKRVVMTSLIFTPASFGALIS
jgi:hypothetical protein